MSRKVNPDLVGLQIPDLEIIRHRHAILMTFRTFNVLSLLALINIRLSALHARRYTAPTCPRSVATNLPDLPSHTLTLLSHAADAAHLPSGEKATWDTCRWCPVSLATGLVTAFPVNDEEYEGKTDHRKRVWSSDPDMSSSGVVLRIPSYLACDISCAKKGLRPRCLRNGSVYIPSASEVGFLPVWSNGPVLRTKSVLSVSVVTQWAWSFRICNCRPCEIRNESRPALRKEKPYILSVPNPDSPIAACGIEHTLGSTRSTPFNHIHAGRVPAESKFTSSGSGGPHSDRSVFR